MSRLDQQPPRWRFRGLTEALVSPDDVAAGNCSDAFITLNSFFSPTPPALLRASVLKINYWPLINEAGANVFNQ